MSPAPHDPLPFAIVDAHQHFWDPTRNYHPWLRDEPPIPFRYGDYTAIRRRYLPPDYRADAQPYVVERTVYVETEWDPRDPDGEMRYVAELQREYGLPSVAVLLVVVPGSTVAGDAACSGGVAGGENGEAMTDI